MAIRHHVWGKHAAFVQRGPRMRWPEGCCAGRNNYGLVLDRLAHEADWGQERSRSPHPAVAAAMEPPYRQSAKLAVHEGLMRGVAHELDGILGYGSAVLGASPPSRKGR